MSHRAAGFTLLELLIAVAVFAVVATTVYTRSGDTLSQLQMLEERTVATWIAQNELAAARIRQRIEDEPMRLGTNSKELVMGGRDIRKIVGQLGVVRSVARGLQFFAADAGTILRRRRRGPGRTQVVLLRHRRQLGRPGFQP